MAIRTTAILVAGIIDVDSGIDITPFIAAASHLVDHCCSTDDYTATQLELIERYLSAHIYTLRDPRATMERAGSVQASYQSKVDLVLSTSHYGQTAMAMDFEGGLAALNNSTKTGRKKTVSINYLGTEPEYVEDET